MAVLSQMRAGFRAPARPPPAGPCPCIRPLDSFLSARPPGRRATARLQVPSPRGPVSHVPFPLQPVLLTSHPNREQTPTCKHPRDTSSPPGPGGKDRSVPNPVAWPPRAWGAFPEDTRCPLPQWAPAAPTHPEVPSLASLSRGPTLPPLPLGTREHLTSCQRSGTRGRTSDACVDACVDACERVCMRELAGDCGGQARPTARCSPQLARRVGPELSGFSPHRPRATCRPSSTRLAAACCP